MLLARPYKQSRRIVGIWLALLAVTGAGGSLEAQEAPGLAVLALPDSLAMLCRAVPTDTIGAAAARSLIAREFRFGTRASLAQPPGVSSVRSRTVAVVFDSGGQPVLLGDRVGSRTGGTEQVIVGRGPDGELHGRWIVVAVDSAKLSRAMADRRLDEARAAVRPPESRDLTLDEIGRVVALASWLWPRRCRGA